MYVFVSPCILHPNLRVDGITSDEDLRVFSRAVARCREFGIDMRELPCPETMFFGESRTAGSFAGRMDVPEFISFMDALESDVRRQIEQERPLCIVGVNSSPTCGATKTFYTDVRSDGAGVFLKRFSDVPLIDVYEFARYSVYIAAPLFSAAERAFNAEIASALKKRWYRVHLPQELDDDAKSRAENREVMIYRENLAALNAADVVVGVIDGADADSGTAWEMGFASALGKRVVALRTDFRRFSGNECVNLMLEMDAKVCYSVEELCGVLTQF